MAAQKIRTCEAILLLVAIFLPSVVTDVTESDGEEELGKPSKPSTNEDLRIKLLMENDNNRTKREESRAEFARWQRLVGGEVDRGMIWPTLDKEACGPAQLSSYAMAQRGDPLGDPMASLENLLRPNTRYLVVFPRAGLGNSLRGFKSSFVFSLLSGRKLVVFAGGAHKQVYLLLCKVFYCFSDMIYDNTGNVGNSFRATFHSIPLTLGVEVDMVKKLFNTRPILTSHSPKYFDRYWFTNDILRDCVMKTLNCQTKRCVHGRAMKYLLQGGPKENLGRTISQFFEGRYKDGLASSIPDEDYLHLKFDAAVHIRTGTSSIEGLQESKACLANKELCEEEQRTKQEKEELAAQDYLNSSFWECLDKLFWKMRRKLITKEDKKPILNIFIATDNENLRPKFVEMLTRHSYAYYSTGSAIHSSKGSSRLALPTMGEFYLLSRSPYIVSFNKFVSTFAAAASEYGNGTSIIYKFSKTKSCDFAYLGTGPDTPSRSLLFGI